LKIVDIHHKLDIPLLANLPFWESPKISAWQWMRREEARRQDPVLWHNMGILEVVDLIGSQGMGNYQG
jgi:hypothetical protein